MKFIDSNIFVYHMREDPLYSKRASAIIRRIEQGEQCATSTFVIAQVCGYMKWRRKADLIPVFLSFLQSLPSIAKTDTVFADFVQAHKLGDSMKKDMWGNNWDDFVIAAQMSRLSLEEIYSNDADFDLIPSVSRVFD